MWRSTFVISELHLRPSQRNHATTTVLCVNRSPIWRRKSYPIKCEHSFRKNVLFFPLVSWTISLRNLVKVHIPVFPKQPLHNTLDFKLTGLTVGRVYVTKRCCTSLQMRERCGCESCQYMCNTDLDRRGWSSHGPRGCAPLLMQGTAVLLRGNWPDNTSVPMPMLKYMGPGNVRCLNMEDCANAKIQCFEFVLIHRERVC